MRKQAVSTACSSTQEEDYFKTFWISSPSFLQTPQALTAMLALPYPINKTLRKSSSVTSQQEPSGTQVQKVITIASVTHREWCSIFEKPRFSEWHNVEFFVIPIQETLTRKDEGQQCPATMSEYRYLSQAQLFLQPGEHYSPLESLPGILQLPSQSKL